MANEADMAALEQYLEGEISLADMQDNPTLYQQVARALQGATLPGIIEAARNMYLRDPSTLPVGVGRPALKRLGETLARKLAEGVHPFQTARALDMIMELDPQRKARLAKYAEKLADSQPNLSHALYQKRIDRMHRILLNERKRTIARTEQAYAQGEGRRMDMRLRGKKFKRSISSGDSKVSDICEANEAQGWVGIDDSFESGAQAPPFHVNCRCTVAYRTPEVDKAAEQRARVQAERTQAAKENAK